MYNIEKSPTFPLLYYRHAYRNCTRLLELILSLIVHVWRINVHFRRFKLFIFRFVLINIFLMYVELNYQHSQIINKAIYINKTLLMEMAWFILKMKIIISMCFILIS